MWGRQRHRRARETGGLGHPGDRINQKGTSRDEESQTHSPRGSAQLCFLGKLLLLSEPQFPYLSDKGDQWPYAQWSVRDQWSLPHARQARGFVSGTSHYLFFFLSPHLLSTHSARHCTRHQGYSLDHWAEYPVPRSCLSYHYPCCHGYYYITRSIQKHQLEFQGRPILRPRQQVLTWKRGCRVSAHTFTSQDSDFPR